MDMPTPPCWRVGLVRLWWVWLACALALWGTQALADNPPPATATATTEQTVLQVFVREGCPHCADAKAFFCRNGPHATPRFTCG